MDTFSFYAQHSKILENKKTVCGMTCFFATAFIVLRRLSEVLFPRVLMVVPDRPSKCRRAVVVTNIKLAPGLDQDLCRVVFAVCGGDHQRSLAIAVLPVQIRLILDEHFSRASLPSPAAR